MRTRLNIALVSYAEVGRELAIYFSLLLYDLFIYIFILVETKTINHAFKFMA